MDPGPGIVFLAALATAAATGLGAVPFWFVTRMSRHWLGLSNALAAGLMLAASLSLMVEGGRTGPWRIMLGMGLGAVLVYLSQRVVARLGPVEVGALHGADARKALLIVGVMTLHSFAEGVGVGVSFGGGPDLGEFISLAIALHNVPEGLAISLVLVPRGVSVAAAAGWSVFSSLPQPVMAVPAYLLVAWFEPVLPGGLGLAAGAMIWMSFADLIPEARAELSAAEVTVATLSSLVLMLGFQELVLR